MASGGFAAIRSVGFEPVGQVFGAAVCYLATVTGIGCPGTMAASYQRQDGAVVVAAEGAGVVVSELAVRVSGDPTTGGSLSAP